MADMIIEAPRGPRHRPWGRIGLYSAPYPATGVVEAGPIIVTQGDLSFGLTHVKSKHGDKIRHFHPGMTVSDYVWDVLTNYQAVYHQPNGSLWLIRENGTRKCAVVAPINMDGVVSYKLITAYPLPRQPRFARRGAIRLQPPL